MTGPEQGFLLLASKLGNPQRKPLTTAQMRNLAERMKSAQPCVPDRQLEESDIAALGYRRDAAGRILSLLADKLLLSCYLKEAKRAKCHPLTRVSDGYPKALIRNLGWEAPAVLWAKGNISFLQMPMISLVGSRDIASLNRTFAMEVGRQAAIQGYALVSGNARGADYAAQRACLDHGGCVISVVADSLADKRPHERILYLSEEAFDADFSPQRALSRNRVIHALTQKTFVAQCAYGRGGTWDGTVKNLRAGWSTVFCFQDGSEGAVGLIQMGAQGIEMKELNNFVLLTNRYVNFFDQ